MDQANKDKLAKALGIPPEEQAVLDSGGDHPFTCTCETCRNWWKLMGPDGDTYGPFKPEDIEDDTPDGQRCKQLRLEYQAEHKGS